MSIKYLFSQQEALNRGPREDEAVTVPLSSDLTLHFLTETGEMFLNIH